MVIESDVAKECLRLSFLPLVGYSVCVSALVYESVHVT